MLMLSTITIILRGMAIEVNASITFMHNHDVCGLVPLILTLLIITYLIIHTTMAIVRVFFKIIIIYKYNNIIIMIIVI